MYRQLIHRGVVAMALLIVVAACINEPDYSDTPNIRQIGPPVKVTLAAGSGVGQTRRDSVITTIRFQDGNGDIGESVSDTARIRRVFGRETWGNYEIRTFQYVDGKFSERPAGDNAKLFFPGPPRQQNGAVEGDIDFSQVFFYQTPYRMVPVKFQIRIRDRAMHVSNTIETDTISVPLLAR